VTLLDPTFQMPSKLDFAHKQRQEGGLDST